MFRLSEDCHAGCLPPVVPVATTSLRPCQGSRQAEREPRWSIWLVWSVRSIWSFWFLWLICRSGQQDRPNRPDTRDRPVSALPSHRTRSRILTAPGIPTIPAVPRIPTAAACASKGSDQFTRRRSGRIPARRVLSSPRRSLACSRISPGCGATGPRSVSMTLRR